MKTLLAHRIVWFTPWATWKHPRDHFKPLLAIALAVLAMDVVFLLKVEADYRRDALIRDGAGTHQNAPGIVFSHEPGATITGEKSGHVTLQF